MSTGSRVLLSLLLAPSLPGVAHAKSYDTFDYGFGYSEVERRASNGALSRRQLEDGRGLRARKGYSGGGYAHAPRARAYGQTAYGSVPGVRGSRQGNARAQTGVAMANRGIAQFSGPLFATSTTCLTPAAQDLLGKIQTKFGKVEIVSTCRPCSTIAGTGYPSKHATGEAIDFRVPGRKSEVVQWLIENDRMGGIMTYSDMDHIHVDVGLRFVALNRPSGRT